LAASQAREQAERARLDAEAAARAKEEEEIAIAEHVIARLRANGEQRVPAPAEPASAWSATPAPSWSAGGSAKIPAANGTPRPDGIPTVPQMVTILLQEAEQAGKPGLHSTEIMQAINDRWWPGVATNLVMPTVYRCISRQYWFAKRGKLIVRLRDAAPPKRGTAGPEQMKLVS
jgi:hypothetical protein